MFLGSKDEVLAAIQRLTNEQPQGEPLRLAVAFWGKGADSLIVASKRYQIICNLTEGGTNPAVIRSLMEKQNVQLRHLPGLHAKVVIGHDRAIVGSANFSANGLGIDADSGDGWHEAAATLKSEGLAAWFEKHWQAALDVSEEALFAAELKWEARAVLQSNASSAAASPQPVAESQDPVQGLAEGDLFKSSITGGNKIRMAARYIENIYYAEIEPETKRSVWNPAYAVSIIWTAAGNRIRTRIEHRPYFETPADVLERAKHAKTIEKVRQFIGVLSSHSDVPPAVRYWATHYLRGTG